MALERDELFINVKVNTKDANTEIEALAGVFRDVSKEADEASDSTDGLADSLDDSGKSAEGAGKSQKGFSDKLKTSAIAITALNQGLELAIKAYKSIKGVVDVTTKAYGVQEKAERDLANALKIQGQFTNAAFQDFKDFAGQLQATTTIGDETTLGLLKIAKALNLTNDQSKEAVKAAAALAAATGQDVNSAFQQVTKTFGGFAGELGEKLPALKNLTKEQLQAGDATALLIKQFGGFAEAARDTFSGQQLAAANAYGDVLEEIGQLFVDVFDLGESAKNLEQFFIKIGTAVDDFRQRLLFILDRVDFDKILMPLKQVATVIGAVLTPLLIKMAIPLGIIAFKFIAIGAAIGAVIVVIDLLISNAEPISKIFEGVGETIASAFTGASAVVGKFVIFVIGKLHDLITAGNEAGVIPDKVAIAAGNALNSISKSVTTSTVEFAKASEDAARKAGSAFAAVEFQSGKLADGITDTALEIKDALAGFDSFQDQQKANAAEQDAIQKKLNAAIQEAKKKEKELADQKAAATLQQAEMNKKAAAEQLRQIEDLRKAQGEFEAEQAAMALKLVDLRGRSLEKITGQNAVLAAKIQAHDMDKEDRARTFLALQLDAIDKQISKLKEQGVILEKIDGTTGEKRIVAGGKILEGLEGQKDLLTEITELDFSTPGESFARFIKDGIKGIEAIKDGAMGAFDSLMEFDPSSIDLSSIMDGLKGAGEGFLDFISDPSALADFGGNLIDIAADIGGTIGSAVMTTVDAVAGAIGSFFDFVFSFDEAALSSLKEFPQKFAQALQSLPEFFKELPGIIIQVVDTFIEAMPAVVQEVLNAIPAIIDAFVEGAGKIIEMLPGLVAQIAEKLPEFIRQILDALPELIEKIFMALPQIVTSLMQAVPGIFIAIVERLPAIIGSVIEGFIGALGEIIGAFIDIFITKGGAFRMAESLVKAIIKLIPTVIKALVNGLARAFKGIFKGFKMPSIDTKPFEKSVKKVVDQASKGAAKVADEVFGLVDLPTDGGSLKKVADDPGAAIAEGVKKTFKNVEGVWDNLLSALKKVWMFIWNKIIKPIADLLKKAWMFIWKNFIEPIIGIVKQAFKFVEGLFTAISTIIKQAFSIVVQGLTRWFENVKIGFSLIVAGLSRWIENIKIGFSLIVAGLTRWIENIKIGFMFIIQMLSQWFENIKLGFALIVAGMTRWFENVKIGFSLIVAGLTRWFDNVKIGFDLYIKGLTRWFENVKLGFSLIVKGLTRWFENVKIGFNLYIKGLTRWFENVKLGFSLIVKGLTRWFENVKIGFNLYIKGLTRWFENLKLGFALIVKGLTRWFENVKLGFNKVAALLKKVLGALFKPLQKILKSVSGPFKQLSRSLLKVLRPFNLLANALKSFKIGKKGGGGVLGFGLSGGGRVGLNEINSESVDAGIGQGGLEAFNNRADKANLRGEFNRAADELKQISGASRIVANTLEGMREVIDEVKRFKADKAATESGVLTFGDASATGFRDLRAADAFASGGLVKGLGFVETPGEFVFNKSAVDAIGAPTLANMNQTGRLPNGGAASVNINSGAIQVNMTEGQSPMDVADTIVEEIKRRSLNGELILASSGVFQG